MPLVSFVRFTESPTTASARQSLHSAQVSKRMATQVAINSKIKVMCFQHWKIKTSVEIYRAY